MPMLGQIAHALFDVVGHIIMDYLMGPSSKKGKDAPTYMQKPFTAPTKQQLNSKFSRV